MNPLLLLGRLEYLELLVLLLFGVDDLQIEGAGIEGATGDTAQGHVGVVVAEGELAVLVLPMTYLGGNEEGNLLVVHVTFMVKTKSRINVGLVLGPAGSVS